MTIDTQLIAYLEQLSCLALSEAEKQRLTEDLRTILDSMGRIGERDTEGVPERSHPFDHSNVFREDVVSPSFDRALILQNAPHRCEDSFIAPKTVE